MASSSRVRLTSAAVDFIDNRLSAYHPAFADPPVHFNPDLNLYVTTITANEMSSPQNAPLTEEPSVMTLPGYSREGIAASEINEFCNVMDEFKFKQ
jgi:hypothetical protein